MYCAEHELIETYREAVGKAPYKHQQDTWKALASGQSVVLRAPMGLGKTEAVSVPLLRFRD